VKTILTDIEGTTSSISFVKEVLFPYSRAALPEFVATRGHEPEVRRWLDQVALENGGLCDDRMIVEVLQGWIDADRKHTALKALQGLIWRAGFDGGAYRAHVYPDAPAQLRAWHAAGHPIYVYSSGSVAAQKLFFAHSEAGDLLPLFSGYFDTEIGGKRETDSYARIAAAIGRPGVRTPVSLRCGGRTGRRPRGRPRHRAGGSSPTTTRKPDRVKRRMGIVA
jgi:enolase-phosphatase E1